MPVRDDWEAAAELIRHIEKAVSRADYRTEILIVDDGSKERCDQSRFRPATGNIEMIRIVRLRRNVGSQRGIAIGLMLAKEIADCDAVVVMDSDGEDTAEGLAMLLDAYTKNDGSKAVFAARARRPASLLFRLFYRIYTTLHLILTGISVRVGNFSILPSRYLDTLSVTPELWNHYAAAVYRSQLPLTTIPIPRGKRIAGASQMDFVALVSHGLSAISVFGDIIGVRFLVASLAGAVLAGLGIFAVLFIRFFTDWAIPGWTTYAAGLLAIILVQFVTMATSFTFAVLASRSNFSFLPLRDCAAFVAEIVVLRPHE